MDKEVLYQGENFMALKKKLVYGVGIDDTDYVVEKKETIEVNGKRKKTLVWFCPFHRTWRDMVKRCYSTKFQERNPTYIGCSVSEEWKRFSNFRTWMVDQDWEGMQLDKDLLVEGNKVYSEETCVFVTIAANNFTTDRGNDRGEWKIGVSWHKGESKFISRCSNPFTKKCEHLGYFDSELEAHEAWLRRKLELAKELAEIQTDPRVAKALINLYLNYNTDIESDLDLDFDI